MPDNRDDLDRLLDLALDTYADPGSDSGLAQRILARVAAEPARRQTRRWLPWAIAVPVAAGLLILALLSGSKPAQRPVGDENQARLLRPPAAKASGERPSSVSALAPNRFMQVSPSRRKPRDAVCAATSTPLPKLENFPTPQPLSPEEQALVIFASHATESERESLIAEQDQQDAPLAIAPITIQPLEPPAAGAN